MRPRRENPLTPASLATDGNQGAGANTQTSAYGAEHSPQGAAALILALTGCRCQCPTCFDYFGNVVGFDRHRVGAFARPGELAHKRRCRTPADLHARGWVRNERGFWLRPSAQRGPVGIQGPRMTPPATHAPARMRTPVKHAAPASCDASEGA